MSDIDTTRIKDIFYSKLQEEKTMKKKRSRVYAASIVAMLFFAALSFTVYAATGGLEIFLTRFNPNFGEFAIAPLEPAYAIDQDIRIEVVGAQQIGSAVLMYITMQDISGENRLSRYNFPDIEFYIDGHVMSGSSRTQMLNFDESTNTAYFERLMVGAVDILRIDKLELIINRIDCIEHAGQTQWIAVGEWRMTVNTSDLGIEPIVWTDVQIGNYMHLEYISLSPFGLQVVGSGTINGAGFARTRAEIEVNNRRRNIRFNNWSGGTGPDGFRFFSFADAPIDIDAVAAVVIGGVRIPTCD